MSLQTVQHTFPYRASAPAVKRAPIVSVFCLLKSLLPSLITLTTSSNVLFNYSKLKKIKKMYTILWIRLGLSFARHFFVCPKRNNKQKCKREQYYILYFQISKSPKINVISVDVGRKLIVGKKKKK